MPVSQGNSHQNPNELFCGYQKTDSKTYVNGQKTQSSQHNVNEGKKKLS